MGRPETLGGFEQAVLLAVARLDGDAYGVTIRREIETHSGRTISVGALYTALDRLEEKHFVTSTMSDPTPRRGGRSKRQFRMTPAGRSALRESRTFLTRMWAGLRLSPGKGRS